MKTNKPMGKQLQQHPAAVESYKSMEWVEQWLSFTAFAARYLKCV